MSPSVITFLRQLPKAYREIGSVIPSSVHLAEKMVEPILEFETNISILEVGAGTGPITKQILKVMKPKDNLTVCEINRHFMAQLEASLRHYPDFKKKQEQVEFICASVEELPELTSGKKYNVILSSLPFSLFPAEKVSDFLELFKKLLAPGGVIVFYEYVGFRKLVSIIGKDSERQRVKEIDLVIDTWKKSYESQTKWTLLNIPPARVQYFSAI
jgi:phosphatidylethanolamine/phosphatidyl-N-methylethanolamine N-methyltransferase